MYNIPAVIFAGGKSSRMGRDKALLPFRDSPTLSEFQYIKLNKLFHKVYLSAKENKFDFACSVIRDNYEQSSPLVAIISLFETLKDDAVFILSVDAPLVEEETIATLWKNYLKYPHVDAIVAKSPKGMQPLCAIYKRSILPLTQHYLANNNHKLTSLLKESSICTVAFNDEAVFTNLNTLNQYKALSFR